MASTVDYWQARLEKKQAQLEELDAALTAALSGPLTHSLDTSQSRQSITNRSVGELRSAIQSLEAQIADLQSRVCGSGGYMRPGF